MQLLQAYYLKPALDKYGKIALRVKLPQHFQSKYKTNKLLRSDNFGSGMLYINVMSSDYIRKCIEIKRWVKYKDLK